VYPHSLKEEISSDLYYDTLLVGCHTDHLRESIDDHEKTMFVVFRRRKARHVIHGDGFPGSTRSRKRSL